MALLKPKIDCVEKGKKLGENWFSCEYQCTMPLDKPTKLCYNLDDMDSLPEQLCGCTPVGDSNPVKPIKPTVDKDSPDYDPD